MTPIVDLAGTRFARLRRALEELERWAEGASQSSHTDPDWIRKRRCVEEADDAAAAAYRSELHHVEGAESAYAEVAARVAHVRSHLPGDLGVEARSRFDALLDALRGELAWCDAQRAEALAAAGARIEPEEQHAAGRALALSAIRVELCNVIDAAPRGAA